MPAAGEGTYVNLPLEDLSLLRKRLFVLVGKSMLSPFPNRERQAALLSRVWQPGSKAHFCPGWYRDKRCCQRHVPGAPFCSGWCYQPGQMIHFFLFLFSQLFFYFDYTFIFQLNLCIEIQCVRSPLIYTYTYIYIYSYLYNICSR